MTKPDRQVDERVDRLYVLPLDEFTAERNALAKDLRTEGDRESAETVKTLKKPSVEVPAPKPAAKKARADEKTEPAAEKTDREAEKKRRAEEEAERGRLEHRLRRAEEHARLLKEKAEDLERRAGEAREAAVAAEKDVEVASESLVAYGGP